MARVKPTPLWAVMPDFDETVRLGGLFDDEGNARVMANARNLIAAHNGLTARYRVVPGRFVPDGEDER